MSVDHAYHYALEAETLLVNNLPVFCSTYTTASIGMKIVALKVA